MTNKTTYINQLPATTQKEIELLIKEHLFVNVGLATYEDDFHDNLNNAMDSRLSDLEDIIDISDYINA